jgi:hypothetical protein
MLLNKHNLNIHKFCATEESRYTLRAILVTKKETVATDGHRLIRVTVPEMNDSLFPSVPEFKADDIDGRILLHADAAKASIPKGKQTIPVLSTAKLGQEDGSARAVTTDLDLQHIVQGRKVEGEFPKWEAVIPTKKPAFEVCLQAPYLKELAEFAEKFSESGIIRVRFYGPEQPVRFDCQDMGSGQGMTAVIMPIRSGSDFSKCFKAEDANGHKSVTPKVGQEELPGTEAQP